MSPDFQSQVEKQGELIISAMQKENMSLFNKNWWYGKVMDWSMKNEAFKVQMFRFIDVLPSLNSNTEIAHHLKEYFSDENEELPKIFNIGSHIGVLTPNLLAGVIKKNITEMARMFIGGKDLKESLPKLYKLRKNKKITFTVDLLGEATLSEKESLGYQKQYLDIISDLFKESEKWESIPLLDTDSFGPIPKTNISIKITSLYSQIREIDWENSKEKVIEKLKPLFEKAVEKNIFLNIDMESYKLKDFTLDIFETLLLDPQFKDYPHFGIVIQSYLKDSYEDTKRLIKLALLRKVPFTVRLVKGAYWDYETTYAQQMNWPIPVYTLKQNSDANYERCAFLLLDNVQNIKLALGSHNIRSIAAAQVYAKEKNIPSNGYEIQMLYGMADPIKKALVKLGYRVREYVPVGELIPGMSYLVRRLLENTSNESFLRSQFVENTQQKILLKQPQLVDEPVPSSKSDFKNEAVLDFTKLKERESFLKALNSIEKEADYPICINGKKITSPLKVKSLNPSHPDTSVGTVHFASLDHTKEAVSCAKDAFQSWSKTTVIERAEYIDKLAQKIKENRYELSALEVYEVGKPWSEADADICEAIDFCKYYAWLARTTLSKKNRTQIVPGEFGIQEYIPRGVCAVIAPWNFPLAILTGMTTAALVTGNTVIMKPAEQSSVIAAHLYRLFEEINLPKGVLSYLPGKGEEIGSYLVNHPDVPLIAFTGSKEVGLKIYEEASKAEGSSIKRCILEMGGKNAIIIDSDADLDEAVEGVIYSAFGFQGQKCSACSRVIVLQSIYDKFVMRLIEAARSIYVEYAENPSCYVGPLIDEKSKQKTLSYIQENKDNILFEGKKPNDGYFIPPTIFANIDQNSKLAKEELFAPVIALFKAKNLKHAIDIANDSPFGLTGGFYSRSPSHIQNVKKSFQVGNLYINRPNTGAIVQRHPFGGIKLSGIGFKAGGPNYLFQFLDSRSITENTLRRGFAPSEELNQQS